MSSTLIFVWLNIDLISYGYPAVTSIELVVLMPPLSAVITAVPIFPGVNKPLESISPDVELQFTGLRITDPLESLTVALNCTIWSVLTVDWCWSIVMLDGVEAITGAAICTKNNPTNKATDNLFTVIPEFSSLSIVV